MGQAMGRPAGYCYSSIIDDEDGLPALMLSCLRSLPLFEHIL